MLWSFSRRKFQGGLLDLLFKYLLKFYGLLISGWTELVFNFYYVPVVARSLKEKKNTKWIGDLDNYSHNLATCFPCAALQKSRRICLIHYYCFLISFTLFFAVYKSFTDLLRIYFWIHVCIIKYLYIQFYWKSYVCPVLCMRELIDNYSHIGSNFLYI